MYTFKIVKQEEIDKYAIEKGDFRQTSIWAKMKSHYFKTLSFSGLNDKKEVVFSCLLLRYFIPLTHYSICYAPRGFISDYDNEQLITEFTKFYKTFMKKHHILYTTFDPEVIKHINFEETEEYHKFDKCLRSLGYQYHEGVNPHRHMQNNNNYRLLINYDNDNIVENTLKSFNKKMQYNINLCQTRGVTIEKYSGEEYLKNPAIYDQFYNIIIDTMKRKGSEGKLLSKEKYKNIIYTLKDFGYIYLAKYNSGIDKDNTLKLITAAEEEIDSLKDLDSSKASRRVKELMENLKSYHSRLTEIEQNSNNPYIATAFFLIVGEQTYYLFGGNSSEVRFAKPTSLVVWHMIQESIKRGAKIFNTGGSLAFDSKDIKQDSMYSVYEFKSGLNGELVDFAGDYFLINNHLAFKLLEGKLKLLKRVNNKY